MDGNDVDVEALVVGEGRKEGKPKLDRWKGARETERKTEREARGSYAARRKTEMKGERERERGTESERNSFSPRK